MKIENKGMNYVKNKMKDMVVLWNKNIRELNESSDVEIFGNLRETMEDETGMGVIEVILIILVLVGLALIFKEQINSIASGIFTSIKGQVNSF